MLKKSLLFVPMIAIAMAAAAPAAKPPSFTVKIEYSTVPDLKDWAEKAKTLVEKWYPILCEKYWVKGVQPPSTVELEFSEMDGIAGTGGNHIGIAAKWVREHPDDWGMVIHELTHVVQSYPQYDPSWLVEGIADYTRYHFYEPQRHIAAPDPSRNSYKGGYWTIGAFLVYMEKKYDKRIVSKLNAALRLSKYTPDIWKSFGGKTFDELWKEYQAWYAVENPKNPHWATE
jgi:hypothetical protein